MLIRVCVCINVMRKSNVTADDVGSCCAGYDNQEQSRASASLFLFLKARSLSLSLFLSLVAFGVQMCGCCGRCSTASSTPSPPPATEAAPTVSVAIYTHIFCSATALSSPHTCIFIYMEYGCMYEYLMPNTR